MYNIINSENRQQRNKCNIKKFNENDWKGLKGLKGLRPKGITKASKPILKERDRAFFKQDPTNNQNNRVP